jgi:hypothetical protein
MTRENAKWTEQRCGRGSPRWTTGQIGEWPCQAATALGIIRRRFDPFAPISVGMFAVAAKWMAFRSLLQKLACGRSNLAAAAAMHSSRIHLGERGLMKS